MELKGSRTEANLMAAIAGESQARNKYIYYAEQARKDGFEQIADIFEETALNEQTHAYLWTLHIRGGSLPKTEDALKDAAGGNIMNGPRCIKLLPKKQSKRGLPILHFNLKKWLQLNEPMKNALIN